MRWRIESAFLCNHDSCKQQTNYTFCLSWMRNRYDFHSCNATVYRVSQLSIPNQKTYTIKSPLIRCWFGWQFCRLTAMTRLNVTPCCKNNILNDAREMDQKRETLWTDRCTSQPQLITFQWEAYHFSAALRVGSVEKESNQYKARMLHSKKVGHCFVFLNITELSLQVIFIGMACFQMSIYSLQGDDLAGHSLECPIWKYWIFEFRNLLKNCESLAVTACCAIHFSNTIQNIESKTCVALDRCIKSDRKTGK